MTFDDVDEFATSLPGVTVGAKWGNRTWMVDDKGFAWQRPFSKADLKRFGDETPPAGEILAVRVEDLDAKDALLAIAPPGFFTIPHFNGYAAVLIALRQGAREGCARRDPRCVRRGGQRAPGQTAEGAAALAVTSFSMEPRGTPACAT